MGTMMAARHPGDGTVTRLCCATVPLLDMCLFTGPVEWQLTEGWLS